MTAVISAWCRLRAGSSSHCGPFPDMRRNMIYPDCDIKFTGHVTWVGKTSIEAKMHMTQVQVLRTVTRAASTLSDFYLQTCSRVLPVFNISIWITADNKSRTGVVESCVAQRYDPVRRMRRFVFFHIGTKSAAIDAFSETFLTSLLHVSTVPRRGLRSGLRRYVCDGGSRSRKQKVEHQAMA